MTKAEQAYEYYINNLEATKEFSAEQFEISTRTLTRYMDKMGYETKENGLVKSTINRKPRENKPHDHCVTRVAYEMLLIEETPISEVVEMSPLYNIYKYAKRNNLPIPSKIEINKRRVFVREPTLVKEALEWKEKTGDTYREASEKFGVSLDAIKQQAYLKRKNNSHN
ncbi:MAG: hypothetical protein ACRC0F_05660 [Cetobacterium sp.]